jgi:2-dehydro-3-deoxyphosphogluconate aldolase/(4S)-4-hydroxy-2-oxoglutarate aldolase
MERQQIVKKILDNKIVAVIRMEDANKLLNVVDAIYKGGVDIIEITMTVPGAINLIEKTAEKFGESVLIGVGSVLKKETAQDAINAGAKFVVSPIFKEEIIDLVHKNNLPAFPGCFTPTEIYKAYERGAEIIKVFPADILGMQFIKAVKAPIPEINLMPTGGVTLSNIKDWIQAGACAVGIGTALLDKTAIKENNYQLLTENAKKALENLKI